MGDCPVVISAEVVPEFREFERLAQRLSTATLPRMSGYLNRLAGHVAARRRWLYVMIERRHHDRRHCRSVPGSHDPVRPAGGVRGAAWVAEPPAFTIS